MLGGQEVAAPAVVAPPAVAAQQLQTAVPMSQQQQQQQAPGVPWDRDSVAVDISLMPGSDLEFV